MDNQLEILLSLYDEEKGKLEELINGCLTDKEYLLAHYHLDALHQLNRQVRILQKLKDRFYDQKQYLFSKIAILEKDIMETDSEEIRAFFSEKLSRAREGLERLQRLPQESKAGNSTPLLDEVLTRLLDKQVRNVRLILKKSENFFFAFTYSPKRLKVTLPYVKKHLKNYMLYEDHLETFKHLGFDMAANGSRLHLEIEGDKEIIFSRLKVLLVKIIFEMFYSGEFKNESYIEYTGKASR